MTAPTLRIGGKAADDASLLRPNHVDAWAAKKHLLGLDLPVPVVVPRLTTFPSQQQAVDALGGLFTECHDLESVRREARDERARLLPRLADPALFGHPKRPAAEARAEALLREAGAASGRQEAAAWAMARIWTELEPKTRTELRAAGWWQGASAEGFRTWVESCLAVGFVPGTEEVGF